MTNVEKTFALIKPDAVRNGKAEEIMHLMELKGFSILNKKQVQVGAFCDSGILFPKDMNTVRA